MTWDCKTCEGTGEVGTGKWERDPWRETPDEEIMTSCDACSGTGQVDVTTCGECGGDVDSSAWNEGAGMCKGCANEIEKENANG